MKSKYLALVLSVALVLSLVACGGQQAQEPEEPKQETQQTEPAITEPETPVESEEVKPIETTAPVETEKPTEETQPQESLTVPEEQETQQSISTPAVENTPTANKPQESKPSGGQTETPSQSNGGQVTDEEIQSQIDAALKQQQEAIANGEVVGTGQVTVEFIESVGSQLNGGGGQVVDGLWIPDDYEDPVDPVRSNPNSQEIQGEYTWDEIVEDWESIS